MKKLMLSGIISLLFAGLLIAQNGIGISTGINYATMSQDGIEEGEYFRLGHASFGTIGVRYKRELDPNWSLITGLEYARRGAESKIGTDISLFGFDYQIGAKLVHRMDYIEAPVLFQYRFSEDKSRVSPYIFFGPQVSYFSSYEIGVKASFIVNFNIYRYDVDLAGDLFRRLDLAGHAGAGLSVPLKRGELNLQAGYLHSITKVMKNPIIDVNIRHSNIRLGVGYYYDF
jgi:hypothetical protein